MGKAKASPARACEPGPVAWTVLVPGWTPPLVNAWSGRHWSARHKLTKATAELLAVYAAIAGVPKVRPGEYAPVRRVEVTAFGWPRGKVPDPDNLLKCLFDGMKRAGLLVDDSSEWLRWSTPVIVRSKTRQTIIRVEDVA